MSTIRVTLEPDPDGTLHLPLPPELRHGKFNVVATIEPADSKSANQEVQHHLKGFGCLQGKIRMSPEFDEPLEDFQEYME